MVHRSPRGSHKFRTIGCYFLAADVAGITPEKETELTFWYVLPYFVHSERFQSKQKQKQVCTACSMEDETRNAELNGNRNPEW